MLQWGEWESKKVEAEPIALRKEDTINNSLEANVLCTKPQR